MADGSANVDYDLDDELAFNLQMEEAIARSLSHLPSTSHSPPPPPPSSSSSRPDYENRDAIVLSDGEDFEDDDKVMSEPPLRNYRSSSAAGDVINISDDDYFEIPYGMDMDMDGSALGMLVNPSFDSESFRVYFQGLVSDETVDGFIFVAVFDPRDNLLMEVRKPLEGVRESQVAELMALVEGLEAALSLDLERVTFFCYDYSLYQYVTGRVLPRLSKVASLVDKVALLRSWFTYCKPFLVEQDDATSAFEVAEVVSKISLPAAETGDSKPLLENCKICYDDRELGQMFTIAGCLHRYCFSCMKKHVEMQFLCGSEAKCPHESCESTVSIESCDKLLSPEVIEIIRQRLKESSIPFSEKVYCPQPRCSFLMSKMEVLEYTRDTQGNAGQSGARKCMKCHKLFCIKCKIAWHNGRTCEDYMKTNHASQTEDAKLNSLAKQKLWKPCMRCGHMVELAEGCYHIICRCGYEFCYTCGAEWKNKHRTCSCPIWDEHYIINNAL